ncbi:hypothetical protein HAV15_000874 [Penicillium sp. str. |nr:hypothetical protein HAV15_000874 [Penicillium sp. str. \
MAPKVFLTGVTGYIGGDGLFAIASSHPDWQFSALVRSEEKSTQVTSKYPQIRTVIGDLDSSELIEEEVKNADIVFHFADCDHVAAAQAIAKGAQHHTPERPLWLIHTSGTGILTVEDQRAGTYGIERPKEYNDWEGVSELVNLPSDAFHRNVDEIILAAGQQNPASVKVAVVCPPTIYGPGRGPGNTKSIQAYLLSAAVLKRKHGFLVGKGENVWHQVHVQDLSNVYLALGEAASRAVAKSAFDKKLIASPDVESLDGAQTTELLPAGIYAWGSNSRGNSIRARKLFGWAPQKPKLIDLIPEIVEGEAKALGLL